MVVRRHKKVGKYRGSTTHGGGHRKKRRGAGSRGGRGRAGSGKRSGHKKNVLTSIGQHGFTSRKKVRVGKIQTINVGDLTVAKLQHWVAAGKAHHTAGIYALDLTALGYDKLLGTGEVTLPLKITVAAWSAQAEEKIKKAGGQVLRVDL